MGKKRFATVSGPPKTIAAYLPDNYTLTHVLYDDSPLCYIEGEDVAGWTLEGYVRPRLESGWWFGLMEYEAGEDVNTDAVEWEGG